METTIIGLGYRVLSLACGFTGLLLENLDSITIMGSYRNNMVSPI